MAKSNVQKFEVGNQVPANWFKASAPATVTYGGDFSGIMGQTHQIW